LAYSIRPSVVSAAGLIAVRGLVDSDAGKNIFGMKHRSGDLGSLVGISLPGLDEGDALERLRLHSLVFDRVSELQSILVVAKLGALNGDGDQSLSREKGSSTALANSAARSTSPRARKRRDDRLHRLGMAVAALYPLAQESGACEKVRSRLVR
jgi:hypothetical protein